MYSAEKAFGRGTAFLCQISQGSCPYQNGNNGFNSIEDSIWYTICSSKGMVEKSGLIQRVKEIKPTPA